MNGEYGGYGVVQSRHFVRQPVLELTCDQVCCPGSKWLLFFPKLKEFIKGHKVSDDENIICTANGSITKRPRTTILLQRNENFGETLDQVHFSWRRICQKVTKYDVRIYLTVSVYELFERPSYKSIFIHCDVFGQQSNRIRWTMQNKGYYPVQGHPRSLRSVSMDFLLVINSNWHSE